MALLPFRKRSATPDSKATLEAFLQGFSIEVMPRTAAKIEDFRALLPAGTRIYVAHIDGTPIDEMVAAAKAAAEGQSMDEIVALLEDQSPRTYCFAALDTVEFLRRSGRLTRFQSSLASVLRIKPLLKMNDGEFDMERVRTRRAALARVIELLRGLGPLEELALVHTHAPEETEALGREAMHLAPRGELTMMAEVAPVIRTHIGPGAVGFVAVRARQQTHADCGRTN